MGQFQLFDNVTLTEVVPLGGGGVALVGTAEAVVDVVGGGKA